MSVTALGWITEEQAAVVAKRFVGKYYVAPWVGYDDIYRYALEAADLARLKYPHLAQLTLYEIKRSDITRLRLYVQKLIVDRLSDAVSH